MLNLIPKPSFSEDRYGEFVINSATTIYADDQLSYARDVLIKIIEGACGFKLNVIVGKTARILFLLDTHYAEESYGIDCTTETLVVRASGIKGAFYAVQSLRQLLLADVIRSPEVLTMNAVKIEDAPRYKWRGIMLDESRHFFGVEVVKEMLDMMAFHKLNVFHWHLTDNEGWRAEIKKYPKLTSIGSERKGTQEICWANHTIEYTPHRGFYTQKEMKEIVAYAARLSIMIVPEIDMPAHFAAAIAAYPELSCSGKKVEVPCDHHDPVSSLIACAGKTSTYTMIYDIIDELSAIFPAPYFHIGGDEAPKGEWRKCPRCQAVIKERNLSGVEDLQAYFNNKIAIYLKRKGKRMIGWNEVLSSDSLEKSVITQYWTRGRDFKVEKALASGRDIICSKHEAFYLDMPYSMVNLKSTYSFEPGKYRLSEESNGILGVEAPLWTEWVPTIERLEFQLYPRMAAVAETAWTPAEKKNYREFNKRLDRYEQMLDKRGIMYCPRKMCDTRGLAAANRVRAFLRTDAAVEFKKATAYRKRKKF